MREGDQSERSIAAEYLFECKQDAIPALIDMLSRDEKPHVKFAASKVLLRIHEGVEAALVNAYGRRDIDRALVIKTLGSMQPASTDVQTIMLSALQSSEIDEIHSALESCLALDLSSQPFCQQIEKMKTHPDGRVRIKATTVSKSLFGGEDVD
jgi:hypothetical protein